jgi:hypothetical protein
MSGDRTFSFDGTAFSTDVLGAGGSGPKRLTGTSPIVGKFKVIHAVNGNMVVAQLEVDGAIDTQWAGATFRPQDIPLFMGTRTVTKITLTSGEGRGYEA